MGCAVVSTFCGEHSLKLEQLWCCWFFLLLVVVACVCVCVIHLHCFYSCTCLPSCYLFLQLFMHIFMVNETQGRIIIAGDWFFPDIESSLFSLPSFREVTCTFIQRFFTYRLGVETGATGKRGLKPPNRYIYICVSKCSLYTFIQ